MAKKLALISTTCYYKNQYPLGDIFFSKNFAEKVNWPPEAHPCY